MIHEKRILGVLFSWDPARSLGVSEPTVRRYLDTLAQTLMVRQLQPWHANLGKRQVKAPKIFFRDSRLLHTLLDITTLAQLLSHPRCGASWEGFALEQVLRLAKPDEAYFWATHQGAELDLLMLKGSKRVGVEFKRADVPHVTRSMHIAMQDLELDALYVVYPGSTASVWPPPSKRCRFGHRSRQRSCPSLDGLRSRRRGVRRSVHGGHLGVGRR